MREEAGDAVRDAVGDFLGTVSRARGTEGGEEARKRKGGGWYLRHGLQAAYDARDALRLAYALVPVQQREMVETARGGEGDLEWASEAGEEDAADVFGEARHGAEGNVGSVTDGGRNGIFRRRKVCGVGVQGAGDLEGDVGEAFEHVAYHAGTNGEDAGNKVLKGAFEVVGLGSKSIRR